MTDVILGIDPGLEGAYAFLAPDGAVTGDLPRMSKEIDAAEFARIVERFRPHVAIVENVASMPKQGVASTFAFGRAYGTILGVLGALEVTTLKVTPAQWKHHYRLSGKDKESARTRAIQLFPEIANLNLKKHHGRAEALLIANWYVEKCAEPVDWKKPGIFGK